MKRISLLLALLALASTALAKEYRSTTPEPRNVEYPWMSIANWYRAHADDVEVAAQGEAQLLFLGDSIFQGWQWATFSIRPNKATTYWPRPYRQ